MEHDSLPRFGIFKTEARVIHSMCVGQDYEVGVWLPFSYADSDRRYPVLYVPDGEFLFPAVMGLMPTLMGNGEVPEMIVVGIGYHGITSWQEFGELRDRDYLPQDIQEPGRVTRQKQYIDFYQRELIPLIDREYRTIPEDRALLGFSSSGFFSLYMMLNHPGLFRRYIAASCTWPGADSYHLECIRRYAKVSKRPPVDLFLSVGGLEAEFLPGFHNITAALQALPEVRLHHQVIKGEGHSAGTIAGTFLKGTQAVFKA